MHPRHGIIVAVAATASLLLHAAVLSSFRSVRVGGGWGRGERFEEMAVVFVLPESDAPKKNKDAPEYEIGEAGAKGYASHKTPGDRSAVAREAPVDASRGGGADPAPLSDSESDPFSVLGSARFVNGELRVRAGRKVRSRRPKIGIAGRFDAIYSRPEVTLRVATDKTGKVTAVEV